MKDGDVAGACPKFEESLRMDPALGTLLNLSACEEQIGRTASAWQHWRAAADQLATGDKRRTMALAHAETLERVLPRVIISLTPAASGDESIEVWRDGLRLGKASLGLAIPVDPGKHVVVVAGPGREPRSYDLDMHAKETRTLVVEPGARTKSDPPPDRVVSPAILSVPGGPPAAGVATIAHTPESAVKPQSLLGWGLVGGGAVALGVAGYAASQVLSARSDASSDCPASNAERVCFRSAADALDRDRRFSLYADIGAGVGAVLVGAGLYFLLHEPASAPSSASLQLTPLPGGGEARLVARF